MNSAARVPNTAPVGSVHHRATHRATVLATRVRMVALIAALTRLDMADMKRLTARATRTERDQQTSRRISEATAALNTAHLAVEHLEGATPGSLDVAHQRDVAIIERNRLAGDLDGAVNARVVEMGQANDQVAACELEYQKAVQHQADTMRDLGVKTADLHDLLRRTGHPEAAELLDCISRPTRAARAACLLEAVKDEARRAQQQLDRVGSSEAYDRALGDLIDAENSYSCERTIRDRAVRNCERSLRVLLGAAHSLGIEASDPANTVLGDTISTGFVVVGPPPGEIAIRNLDFTPADANGSAPAGSGPGGGKESPVSQGTGDPSPMVGSGSTAESRPDDFPPDLTTPAAEVRS